jgi:hypothetical protein
MNKKSALSRLLLVALLIATVSALFFWDFVRENIVIPIYFSLWVSDLVIKSVPQQAYLALLILGCIVIGFSALGSTGSNRLLTRMSREGIYNSTPYGHWKRLYSSLRRSTLFKNQFALEVRRLVLTMLAYQEGVTPPEIEARIKHGTLIVPAEVEMLVRERDFLPSATETSGFRRRAWRLWSLFGKTEPVDPRRDEQLAQVIRFIESRLEIVDEPDQPEN